MYCFPVYAKLGCKPSYDAKQYREDSLMDGTVQWTVQQTVQWTVQVIVQRTVQWTVLPSISCSVLFIRDKNIFCVVIVGSFLIMKQLISINFLAFTQSIFSLMQGYFCAGHKD